MTLTFFMALFAPLLILLGFAALCLGMEKHCKEHLRMPLSPQNLRRLRVLGWSALLLSSYKSTVRGLVRLRTLSSTGRICSNASLLISFG
jgi:hypothetical protein